MVLQHPHLIELARELSEVTAGALIQRIYQVEPGVLLLHLYQPRRPGAHAGETVVVVDVDPTAPALGLLARDDLDHPPAPPAFCMLLRKHLEGSRVQEAACAPEDRVVQIRCGRAGTLQASEVTLCIEFIGRRANVVLVRDGRVVGWMRPPPAGRPAPGQPYALPPPPAGATPAPPQPGGPAAPGGPHPDLVAVGSAWRQRFARQQLERYRRPLVRELADAERRLLRRLEQQQASLASASEAERWRRSGELLLTYLHHVPAGATQVHLPPEAERAPGQEAPVPIMLEPSLSPAANAARYFQRYRKARRAQDIQAARWRETREALEQVQLWRVLASTAASPEELAAVESEWRAFGAPPVGATATRKPAPRRPGTSTRPEGRGDSPWVRRFRSADGWDILAGRSARGNDHLILHQARPDDWWLHARQIPGAHVVIRHRADPLPERTLQQAAALAAHLSAHGQAGTPVAVDLTRCRYVRKPPGVAPGFVRYTGERTLMVRPDVADLPAPVINGGSGESP